MEKHKGSSLLTRDDFDGGPVSLDLIDDGLYLGNVTAACDLKTLSTLKITHVLTLDSIPLPRRIVEMSNIITKYIQIADMPKEDILCHFEEIIDFINSAHEKCGIVLVHCYFGMSRSATAVIAFVMNKYNVKYDEAFEKVRSKRSLTNPNPGFITQLKLYGSMGSKIDKTHDKYRSFRLKIAAEKVRKASILPQTCMDLIKPDPGLTQARPEPLVYRCRKCRRIVASQSNIILHGLKKKNHSMEKISESGVYNMDDSLHKVCIETEETIVTLVENLNIMDDIKSTDENGCQKTYFVEPLAWMKGVTQNTQGKLHCPHCKNKLGSFSWLMGCQCPCGVKVSPAFYLVPSKVEWSNVVQNVQTTI